MKNENVHEIHKKILLIHYMNPAAQIIFLWFF